MPEPQEQNPTEARFARIEAAHEFLAAIVAEIGVAQKNTEYALSEAVEHMARGHKELHTAQVIMFDEMGKLAVAQARTEVHMDQLAVKSAETQGKLDALIHMWDNWIVENGKTGKTGNPAPEPDPGTGPRS